MKKLREKLEKLKGRSYGGYKSLRGLYSFVDFGLAFEHIQSDPFATPSSGAIRIPFDKCGYPREWLTSALHQVPLGDFIHRRLHHHFKNLPHGQGTGTGGTFILPIPRQQILHRTVVSFSDDHMVIRFRFGLPAEDRRINIEAASEMFFGYLPDWVQTCCFMNEEVRQELEDHITLYLRQRELQAMLPVQGLAAFIPNGALLPRASGRSDKPLGPKTTVPFLSPPSLERTITLKDGTVLTGMGVSAGITLLVGGGFHGKSTVLEALELGIYPHIKDDGREFVCSLEQTVKVRSENGRQVSNVNIEPFIKNLPQGADTRCFSTSNASGSTSQAADIIESVNAGARTLLMDEDTCATNFMIRDEKMSALIAKEDEPITPFIDCVEDIYARGGVSTILVIGGVGDYFQHAHCVIGMKNYLPSDLTAKARAIAGVGAAAGQAGVTSERADEPANIPTAPVADTGSAQTSQEESITQTEQINPDDSLSLTAPETKTGAFAAPVTLKEDLFKDPRRFVPPTKSTPRDKNKIKVRGRESLRVGALETDISSLGQVVCQEQFLAIGQMISDILRQGETVDITYLKQFTSSISNNDFSVLSSKRCDFAGFRLLDLLAVLNRTPGFKVEKA